MMTNHEMLQAALAQSARDFNCAPGDFLQNRPVVKSGFVPAWVELSIQPAAVLEKQNQSEPVFI